MTIKKALKTYYTEKLRIQKLPEMPDSIYLVKIKNAIRDKLIILKQSLIFYIVLFLSVGFFLWVNSNTADSLKKIDPRNERIKIVEQKIKKELDKIYGYFYPGIKPTKKGGQL